MITAVLMMATMFSRRRLRRQRSHLKIRAVFAGGRYLDRAALDELLAGLARENGR